MSIGWPIGRLIGGLRAGPPSAAAPSMAAVIPAVPLPPILPSPPPNPAAAATAVSHLSSPTPAVTARRRPAAAAKTWPPCHPTDSDRGGNGNSGSSCRPAAGATASPHARPARHERRLADGPPRPAGLWVPHAKEAGTGVGVDGGPPESVVGGRTARGVCLAARPRRRGSVGRPAGSSRRAGRERGAPRRRRAVPAATAPVDQTRGEEGTRRRGGMEEKNPKTQTQPRRRPSPPPT